MNTLHDRLEALFSISREISSTLQLEEVLQRVVAHACRLMEARIASLLLVDKDRGLLRPAATYGASDAYLALPDREVTASLTGEVIKSGLSAHSTCTRPSYASLTRVIFAS
jgi:signal transduction protein with GAF and PtsI domain